MHKRMEIFMVICLFITSFVLARKTAAIVSAQKASDPICVVIDAGHGGWDPGKVSASGALEKDINLALSLQLKKKLEEHDIKVYLTRSDDNCLSDSKQEDFKERIALIEKVSPVLTISIHQNSFTDSSVAGPQVFYYMTSSEGQNLAEILQAELNNTLQPASPRSIKSNDDYYLIKNTPTPTVIVECGFLSNPSEAALLCDAEYQNKISDALCTGILSYLSSTESVPSTENSLSTETVLSTENSLSTETILSTENSLSTETLYSTEPEVME